MNKLFFTFILSGFIFFMVGMAFESVGKMPTSCDTPYSWTLPLGLFLMMIYPAILGYLIGKDKLNK